MIISRSDIRLPQMACASCLSMTPRPFVQNKKEISRGHELVVDRMTFDEAGTYVCVISVPEIEGMDTSGTLRVQVKGKSLDEPSAR